MDRGQSVTFIQDCILKVVDFTCCAVPYRVQNTGLQPVAIFFINIIISHWRFWSDHKPILRNMMTSLTPRGGTL